MRLKTTNRGQLRNVTAVNEAEEWGNVGYSPDRVNKWDAYCHYGQGNSRIKEISIWRRTPKSAVSFVANRLGLTKDEFNIFLDEVQNLARKEE